MRGPKLNALLRTPTTPTSTFRTRGPKEEKGFRQVQNNKVEIRGQRGCLQITRCFMNLSRNHLRQAPSTFLLILGLGRSQNIQNLQDLHFGCLSIDAIIILIEEVGVSYRKSGFEV